METNSPSKIYFLKTEKGTFSNSINEYSIILLPKPDKHFVLVAVIKYFDQKATQGRKALVGLQFQVRVQYCGEVKAGT